MDDDCACWRRAVVGRPEQVAHAQTIAALHCIVCGFCCCRIVVLHTNASIRLWWNDCIDTIHAICVFLLMIVFYNFIPLYFPAGYGDTSTWCFSQIKGALDDDVTDADIISCVEFNGDGDLLATGDKGGRVVIFQVSSSIERLCCSWSPSWP